MASPPRAWPALRSRLRRAARRGFAASSQEIGGPPANDGEIRGVGGRPAGIQRLVGRSLRSIVDMNAMGERTILLDCDVLQADGGTRTAAVTGAYVALVDACKWMIAERTLKRLPLTDM